MGHIATRRQFTRNLTYVLLHRTDLPPGMRDELNHWIRDVEPNLPMIRIDYVA